VAILATLVQHRKAQQECGRQDDFLPYPGLPISADPVAGKIALFARTPHRSRAPLGTSLRETASSLPTQTQAC
jgi:hypothetical protein